MIFLDHKHTLISTFQLSSVHDTGENVLYSQYIYILIYMYNTKFVVFGCLQLCIPNSLCNACNPIYRFRYLCATIKIVI